MDKNIFEKFELVDGNIIMDCDFNVICANEDMHRFIGVSVTDLSMVEIIHQVDFDDFKDVISHIKTNTQKEMVLRMRRSDNSHRWMLMRISARKLDEANGIFTYYELNISDILTLKKQNKSLQKNLLNFRHLLAMENEIFFTYDYETDVFQINNFLDNEIHNIMECSFDEFKTMAVSDKRISDDTVGEFIVCCDDILNGAISYSHIFNTNLFMERVSFDKVEFRGSTIYQKNKSHIAVGSVRILTDSYKYKSLYTVSTSKANEMLSYEDINSFCEDSIMYDENSEIALILIEIDNLNDILENYGQEYFDKIYKSYFSTLEQMTHYRGTVCEIKSNLVCIAIKGINTELYLRAFIESLRNQVAWNIRLLGMEEKITFSIGAARYPQNGKDLRKIHRKLVKALGIAIEKGRDRYIIYKEYLHENTNLQ
ncbi:MAG: diguanylate cyclase domain-containing protein [Lachnospira sp.]